MLKKDLKIIFTTIPIRKRPAIFPPIAILELCNSLIEESYNPKFYDINALRPTFKQIEDYFNNEQPDIVGISAVVSTSYKYVKELSNIIKKVSPLTNIILGGCLATSANIILKKCFIDICVIGEGEKTLLHLLDHYIEFNDFNTKKSLSNIKGIAFLDFNKNLIQTELVINNSSFANST